MLRSLPKWRNEETSAILNSRGVDAEPINAISAQPSGNGNNIHVEVKPEYNISGNTNADEWRTVLDEQTQNLRAMVEEVMQEVETDRERSVYA